MIEFIKYFLINNHMNTLDNNYKSELFFEYIKMKEGFIKHTNYTANFLKQEHHKITNQALLKNKKRDNYT